MRAKDSRERSLLQCGRGRKEKHERGEKEGDYGRARTHTHKAGRLAARTVEEEEERRERRSPPPPRLLIPTRPFPLTAHGKRGKWEKRGRT